MSIGSELLILIALALGNGVFSGAELAIISVRKTRLQELVEAGSSRALAVKALRDSPERFLATVQIGITVIGASAAAFGGASLAARLVGPLRRLGLGDMSEQVSFVVVVALVSYLTLVVGELVPKSLALKFSESYALVIAKPLQALAWIGRPVVWGLTASSNLVLRVFGDRTTFTESRLSPDELRTLVEESAKAGMLHPRAGEIASRAFALGELRVLEVMVPRGKIQALALDAKAEEVKRTLLENGHSRMPVYDGRIDNIVGYVIAKDLLALVWEKDLIVLQDIVRPVYFVPETKPAVDALQELQRRRTQLGIVVDELGTVVGLITVEDLVEEVVGEIFHEHEQTPELVHREAEGRYLVQASVPLRELNRQLGLELPEGEGFTTVGGLVLFLAGRIPEPGARLTAEDGTLLEVADASPRRVRSVRVHLSSSGASPRPS